MKLDIIKKINYKLIDGIAKAPTLCFWLSLFWLLKDIVLAVMFAKPHPLTVIFVLGIDVIISLYLIFFSFMTIIFREINKG